MTNVLIAKLLDEIADLLEFQGANPFRVRAYRNAARTVGDLGEPIAAIVADASRKLTDISGIGIELAADSDKRMLWAEADGHVSAILADLRGVAGVRHLEAAGSYRRGKDTVGDLDFLCVADDGAAVMNRLAAYDGVDQVIGRGET